MRVVSINFIIYGNLFFCSKQSSLKMESEDWWCESNKIERRDKIHNSKSRAHKNHFATFQNLMPSRLCVTAIFDHNVGLQMFWASSLLTLVEEPWRTGGDSSCGFWSVLEAICAASSDCRIFAMVASKLTSTMVPSSSSGMMNRTIAVLWWPLIAAPEKKDC